MNCACGSVALSHVGAVGFCKRHAAEALAATKRAKVRSQSEYGLAGAMKLRDRIDARGMGIYKGFATKRTIG